MILIVYCFENINTYVGDEPTQQDEEMDEVVEHPIGHIPAMPQRLDLMFWIELEDCICHMFTTEDCDWNMLERSRKSQICLIYGAYFLVT